MESKSSVSTAYWTMLLSVVLPFLVIPNMAFIAWRLYGLNKACELSIRQDFKDLVSSHYKRQLKMNFFFVLSIYILIFMNDKVVSFQDVEPTNSSIAILLSYSLYGIALFIWFFVSIIKGMNKYHARKHA